MAVLSAGHLLDQADRLAATPTTGRAREVDLRRAISSAYYAAFHTIVTAAADEFVGVKRQQTPEHALVMRSIDHVTIRKTCEELVKLPPPARYQPYLPKAGLGPELRRFIEAFPTLQQQRHAADYDSLARYSSETARGSIAATRAAIKEFWAASDEDRKTLLLLLLFPPRR